MYCYEVFNIYLVQSCSSRLDYLHSLEGRLQSPPVMASFPAPNTIANFKFQIAFNGMDFNKIDMNKSF